MARYFSNSDWINTPISALTREPALQRYVHNLFTSGAGPGMPQGHFALPTTEYSNPIVDASTATGTIPVYQRDSVANRSAMDGSAWNLATFGMKSGDRIPWSWSWLPATGNDALLQIVDPAHDQAFDVWMCDRAPWIWNYLTAIPAMAANGWASGIGVGTVFKYSGIASGSSAPGGGRIGSRGCGLHKLAGTITLAALEAKKLDFMSGIYVANPMFGPTMVTPETNWQDPQAGLTKGWYGKGAAVRLEHKDPATLNLGGVTGQAATDAVRALSLPSGIRFAVDATPAQIEAWITSRGYTGARADTARTIATGWVQYGFGVMETEGPSSHLVVEMEGALNQPTRAANLGLKVGQYDDLMDSFATEQNTFAVRPAA